MIIRVPASSANLGPGFDCFGIAWQLYNELEFTTGNSGLKITGCDKRFRGEDNLAYKAYCAALERYKIKPQPLKIRFLNCDIPISRGLGSSSALLVAGVLAANALHDLNMTQAELLSVATALEGHPDNVAPAIFGGLTASAVEAGIPLSVRYPLSDKLYFTALIPPFELSTELSRKALPHSVPRADAVFNVSRAALLLSASAAGISRFCAQLWRISSTSRTASRSSRGLILPAVLPINAARKPCAFPARGQRFCA